VTYKKKQVFFIAQWVKEQEKAVEEAAEMDQVGVEREDESPETLLYHVEPVK
jgi:hypothetical protein